MSKRPVYKPNDPTLRGGLSVRVIRFARGGYHVLFWCGGQKLTDTAENFRRDYFPPHPEDPQVSIPR